MGSPDRMKPASVAALRAWALLAGALALILQLALASPPLAFADPAATALAELSLLAGDPHVLCADVAGDHNGDAPAHSGADCTGVCCHLGHGLTAFLPPPVAIIAALERRSTALSLPARLDEGPRRHLSVNRARGPPTTV